MNDRKDTNRPPLDAVIVGAGLAGLAAATSFRSAGLTVRLLESSDRVGGVVRTADVDGHLFECGPTTVPAEAPTLRTMIAASGLEDRLVASNPRAKRRYIELQERLVALPATPQQVLTSDLLTLRGKLRLLAEPWIPKRRSRTGGSGDETLAEFFSRRLGKEAQSRLAVPVANGVYAGRPEELGIEAFPRLAEWEQEYGSLFAGLRHLSRQKATTRGLLSFQGGLEELPTAMSRHLEGSIRCACEVRKLTPPTSDQGRWTVEYAERDSAATQSLQAETVVVATPASAAARLLSPWLSAAESLSRIPHAGVCVVGLGYETATVAHPLDGFGLLRTETSPESEPVLGVLFASSIFPNRAPAGRVTLSVMIGGTRYPEAVEATDTALVEIAHRYCKARLGAERAPHTHHIARWRNAIPQYRPGHAAQIAKLTTALDEIGAIRLAGNYLSGVGVEATAESGMLAAKSLRTSYPPSDAR